MKYYFFFLSLFFYSEAHLQTGLNWGIEVKPKIGFLVAKRGEVAHLPSAHTFAGEISFVLHTNGKKDWHKAFNYPTIGATLIGASVGNEKILGTFWGSYAFIEFPFLKTKHYQLSGKLGNGLALGTKVYDPQTDPKNSVVSTHLNALVCFGLQNRFTFNRSQFAIGLDLTHFSNGAFKVPNIGINMPFLSIGYGYRFKSTEKDTTNKITLPFRKILYGLSTIYSHKEIFPTGLGKLPVYEISSFARYFFNHKVGCEFSLDVVSKQVILRYKPEIQKNQLDVIQVGVFAGYLLPLDKFHLVLGMGMNIRDKYQPESFLYHRIGMRYYFENGIHLNAVLRSNWAKADFVEWGIGYTFNYRKQ